MHCARGSASLRGPADIDVGPFSVTQPNPTHDFTDPTQPNPSSSSSDRVDSRGPLRQPGVATTTSLRPFSTNTEGGTIADLLDP